MVTLASATGKYGGPFDTAVSQARLTAHVDGVQVSLLAGHLAHDAPEMDGIGFNFITPKVSRIIAGSGFVSCFSWKMLAAIFLQVRESDVVHVSFSRELVPLTSSIIAIALRKSLVLQPHGMITARTSRIHRVVDLVARPIFAKATRVIALTELERSQLDCWASTSRVNRVDVIGNPLPYVPSSVADNPVPDRAVFIARLEPRKRVLDFVEARRVAYANGWPEAYEIIGPDQGDGHAVMSAVSSTPGLYYRGAVPSSAIESVLATAGVFVLTSENEPWGNVLVAALATNVPVVVTRSAALAEEIKQNNLGLVVPDGDPSAVAGAVHRVLGGQWRTTEQAETAKAFAKERFNQEAIRQKLLATYTSSLQGEPASLLEGEA